MPKRWEVTFRLKFQMAQLPGKKGKKKEFRAKGKKDDYIKKKLLENIQKNDRATEEKQYAMKGRKKYSGNIFDDFNSDPFPIESTSLTLSSDYDIEEVSSFGADTENSSELEESDDDVGKNETAALTLPKKRDQKDFEWKKSEEVDLRKMMSQVINNEMGLSYKMLAMACHFLRIDISLPGFARFFRRMSRRHDNGAARAILYLLENDSWPTFDAIAAPADSVDWAGPAGAVAKILEDLAGMRKYTNGVYKKAQTENNVNCQNFLRKSVFPLYTNEEKSLRDMKARLERAGNRVGVLIIDRELMHSLQ